MDYIGAVEGMNFTPISNYNNLLKNNVSFDVNSDLNFENVLNQQTAALQNPMKVQGGVEINNFDNVLAQSINSVSSAEKGPSGNFFDSFGQSVTNGLGKVNDSLVSAQRAQEAMAMGEDVSAHDVMIAAEKASLNMQLAMQLRNKLLSAYTEINNIRV